MLGDASTGGFALITGGSSGIGLETARGLASHFGTVGIVGRNADRLAEAAEALASTPARIETLRCDFTSLAEVRRLAEDVRQRFSSLQVLVNNAGAWYRNRNTSADGYEATFAVNHLAHFLLTKELGDLLAASAPARVVNVSSSMHARHKSLNWEDLMFEQNWKGFLAYSHSKLANVLFSNELARRWQGRGVTSNSLHPGNVRSRITRDNKLLNALHRSPLAQLVIMDEAQGAKTSIYCATADELAQVTGKYFVRCKEKAPSKAAQDPEAAARLWAVSEELVQRVL
jgi:NAD(P)-dependent dehydrogenase (short-subunit alcohol dehydrogenase family)